MILLTKAKTMAYFLGHNNFANMVFLLLTFTILVFSERSTEATEILDLLADDTQFLGREDMVKWAGYGEEKLSTVEIGGKLLCHAGGARGQTSIHHHPVSGATMAVVCVKSTTTLKKSWAKGTTDSSGSFLIDLPSHLHAIRNLEEVCHVKVVHLPETSPCCSRKHKPIRLTSVAEGIRSYTTNNIDLMPHKRT